jgi:hypothetical protein
MCPIRSGSSWTTAKTLSIVVHIVLAISIIGAGLSASVQREESLLIMIRIINSNSKIWTAAGNRVYNQQWFVMGTTANYTFL